MKNILLFIICLFSYYNTRCQAIRDSTSLNEVVVKAYFSEQPLLRVPSSISVINSTVIENQSPASLVPTFNTVPGVKMEERSPGSYRLSLRGSLLRSPFGIRNVKMYMDDFLLTDAGGNTYLNLLDVASASTIEVLKGPEGSVFGANSGGVVVLNTRSRRDTNKISASITGGAYGLFHENVQLRSQIGNIAFNINQAWQRSDGYRQNSSLNRKYIHLAPEWKYNTKASLKVLALFSDLNYKTPGGLTAVQYQNDPRAARPGTPTSPGAAEQQAHVFNQTFLGGLAHEFRFSDRLRHVIAFTAAHTNFENPFITNYETRAESSTGLRTYIDLKASNLSNWSFQTGFEAQQTHLNINRFENNRGKQGSLQTSDFMRAGQGFFFARFSVNPIENLLVESAFSLNQFSYRYKSDYPSVSLSRKKRFDTELMPRLAASYTFAQKIALRVSISKGYSPPTLEEVNPSISAINPTLQAEHGWNRELGIRTSLLNNRLYWDLAFFHFAINDAIVRNVAESDIVSYRNAGGTKQQGLESELIFRILSNRKNGFLRGLQFRNAYTYSHFKFNNYINEGTNFSGNWLTGVPKHVIVSSFDFQLLSSFSFFTQYNATSSLPLNDANTVYADRYHLVTARASWNKLLKHGQLTGFAGADNLLNENYSLGNDLNAFGGRYFNAAPLRNFYAGFIFKY